MMKKLLSAVAALVGVAVLFTACGRSAAAKDVDAKIRALSRVSLESAEELQSVRAAYNALSEDEKAQVKKIGELEAAEAEYRNYLQINEDIAQMIALAQAPFSNADAGVSNLLARAGEIRAEYGKMSAFQKQQIRDIDRMEEAAETLRGYVQNAETAAAVYVKAFQSVYAGDGYAVTGIFCLKNIRDGKEYHFFALTYTDKNNQTHTVYSTARCTAQITVDEIAAQPEIFFADAPVSASGDALQNGNVTLDLETVLALGSH